MSARIKTAVLATSAKSGRDLKSGVEATGVGDVVSISTEYEALSSQALGKKLEEHSPEIILIDVENRNGALDTLSRLNDALPNAWLFVTSTQDDAQLVIDTMRAGAREFLTKPVSVQVLQKAYNRYIAEKRRSGEEKEAGALYCVMSAKGGAGATSVAINLSASISRLPGTRAALIDLGNPVGDTATYLNIRSDYSVVDALAAGTRLDSTLLESFLTQKSGFSVLPGLKEFQPDWTEAGIDALEKTITIARKTHTHTLIDLPCSVRQNQLKAFGEMSDAIIVVITPELPTLWRAHRLLQFLNGHKLGERVRLVLNRSQKNDQISFGEIKKTLGCSVDFTLPNDYRRSIASINAGKPLADIDRSSLAAQYDEVAQILTGISPAKKKGLLGLFS